MKSLLAFSVAIPLLCSWWATWPDRTIKHFNQLSAEGKFKERAAMIFWRVPGEKGNWVGDGFGTNVQRPTMLNLILARREIYEMVASDGGVVSVNVVRDKVVISYRRPPPKATR